MRLTPLALLLPLTLGCTTWRPVTLPTPADSAWSAEGNLRLSTPDGRQLRATRATMRSDSLQLTGAQGVTIAQVPRDQAGGLQRQQVDPNRTGILIVALLTVAVITVAVAASSLSGLGGGYGY